MNVGIEGIEYDKLDQTNWVMIGKENFEGNKLYVGGSTGSTEVDFYEDFSCTFKLVEIK